jgi:class 3 adenylate cyclase
MDAAKLFEGAGLYDPHAADAADRLALLEWLVGRGVTVEQMVRAEREGLLTAVAGDLELHRGPGLTIAEVAARTGLSAVRIEEIRLAAGLPPIAPDDPVLSEEEARTFAAFAVAATQFGETATRRFTRVMGSSLARIAEAAVSLFLVSVEGPLREAQASQLALAQANLHATESLGLVPPALTGVFRAHLQTAVRRFRRARRSPSVDTARLTVGFVDLVGYTTLSRRLTARELATVVDRFEDTAHELTTARDGRVVKLIGDEVMFVTFDAQAACDIALSLVEHFCCDPSITPRGGLATGDILVRGGDYYGPTVNLAARLAELAVPKEVLVTAEVAAEAEASGLQFGPAGKRLLRGFDEPVPVLALARGRGTVEGA